MQSGYAIFLSGPYLEENENEGVEEWIAYGAKKRLAESNCEDPNKKRRVEQEVYSEMDS